MDEVRHAPTSDEVADGLASIRSQVETLICADFSRVDDEAVLDAAVELEELDRLVSLVQCAIAGVVNSRDLDGQRGYSSPVNFLRDVLRIPTGEAKNRLAAADQFLPRTALTGEQLPAEYPHLGEALAEGTVSLEHARVAATTLRKLPDAVSLEERDDAEQQLAKLARDWCPAELGKCATHLARVLDPDGVLSDEKEKHAKQEFTLTKDVHGMYRARGWFDPESVTYLDTALRPLMKPQQHDDGARDPRSAAQRRAKALVEAVRLGLAHADMPTARGAKPKVIVTTTLGELQAKAGTGGWPGGDLASIEAVLETACDADATLAVLAAPGGRLLYYGEDQRFASPKLREAVTARDGGCVFDGCDAGPQRCHAHHITHWTDGGATSIDNLTLVCESDHRRLHREGWHVRMINGIPHVIPPPWVDAEQKPRRNRYRHPPEP